MKRTNSERRQYPRIEKKFPVKITANGYDFATSTQNISCLGAYCHIDKYVPPFTKISVKIKLPMIDRSLERGNFDLECKGVIVRTEDVENKGFNIAIFFNEINNNQRKKIAKYLSQFVPQTSAPARRL